jgi:predicted negative regulator of RcsB-dependent stress response
MSKYTRKQKGARTEVNDEFVSFWQKAFERTQPYLRAIGLVLASAAVGTAVIWGWAVWMERKSEGAAEAYARAARLYEADLLPAGEKQEKTDDDAVQRYGTVKERGEAVLAELDKLDKSHGSSTVAKTARLFRAGVLYDLGRWDEAAQQFEKVVNDHPAPPIGALAAEGAGLCDEQRGKLDEALARYRDMEPKNGDFYRDRALYNQGRIWLKKGNKKKALEVFKEAISKVPTTPIKDELQNQIQALEGA